MASEIFNNDENLSPGSEIYTTICASYPFFDKQEEEKFHKKVTQIETKDPIEQVRQVIEALDNPHTAFYKKEGPGERIVSLPSAEMVKDVLILHIPSLAIDSQTLTDLYNKYESASKALILDLRGGALGFERTGRELAKKLVKKGSYEFGTTYEVKPEGGLEKHTCIFNSDNENPYTKPIVILTSNKTFSSGERLIAALKASTNVLVMGTETRGGSANSQESEIDINGENYVVKIPSWRFVLKGESRPIEETKVKPDIKYDKDDIINFAIRCIDELE